MLGSNYTFLAIIWHNGRKFSAVYKPLKGEQPLWDFPASSLARREVAAYLVSQALGWNFVPLTILREDGPFGPGSLQQFIEYDPNDHYFNFSAEDRARLRPAALFDLLCNNADRKGSHVILEKGTGKLWLIDHGLCFHAEEKLRTVIWDFAGEPLPDALLSDIDRLRSHLSPTGGLRADLEPHLSPDEIAALAARAEGLLAARLFPFPPADRRAVPWPLL